jgi:hypothetical protein
MQFFQEFSTGLGVGGSQSELNSGFVWEFPGIRGWKWAGEGGFPGVYEKRLAGTADGNENIFFNF